MKIVGYNVTFYNAIGGSFVLYFSSFDSLVKTSEHLVTSGYFMVVAPVFE